MTTSPTHITAPARIDSAGDVAFFNPPPGTREVWINLRQLTWIAPIGIVGLLALHYRARETGLRKIVTMLPTNRKAKEYLDLSGFLSELENLGAELADGTRAPAGTLPIQPCLKATLVRRESEMEDAADALSDTLRSINAPLHAIDALYVVMTELTNNAWQHGSDCYVMAQTHTGATSGTPGLHLAIADFGPGFKQTLAKYNPTSEAAAIEKAFEEGVTGTERKDRGYGLAHVLEQIDRYPAAELSIVSQDGRVERRGSEFHASAGGECGGVFVTAYFPFSN